ncbi:MAG: hypothetical protein JY451_13185 [Erythrobacter sp.]|nr:MAG: hypothetical protein JY451_13185 [Erythrobacter sp.]
MARENAPLGLFVTAQPPTRGMERGAAAVGVWENELTGRKHPRLQILTLAELFQNKRPDIPWVDASMVKQAKRDRSLRYADLIVSNVGVGGTPDQVRGDDEAINSLSYSSPRRPSRVPLFPFPTRHPRA